MTHRYDLIACLCICSLQYHLILSVHVTPFNFVFFFQKMYRNVWRRSSSLLNRERTFRERTEIYECRIDPTDKTRFDPTDPIFNKIESERGNI